MKKYELLMNLANSEDKFEDYTDKNRLNDLIKNYSGKFMGLGLEEFAEMVYLELKRRGLKLKPIPKPSEESK